MDFISLKSAYILCETHYNHSRLAYTCMYMVCMIVCACMQNLMHVCMQCLMYILANYTVWTSTISWSKSFDVRILCAEESNAEVSQALSPIQRKQQLSDRALTHRQ